MKSEESVNPMLRKYSLMIGDCLMTQKQSRPDVIHIKQTRLIDSTDLQQRLGKNR